MATLRGLLFSCDDVERLSELTRLGLVLDNLPDEGFGSGRRLGQAQDLRRGRRHGEGVDEGEALVRIRAAPGRGRGARVARVVRGDAASVGLGSHPCAREVGVRGKMRYSTSPSKRQNLETIRFWVHD